MARPIFAFVFAAVVMAAMTLAARLSRESKESSSHDNFATPLNTQSARPLDSPQKKIVPASQLDCEPTDAEKTVRHVLAVAHSHCFSMLTRKHIQARLGLSDKQKQTAEIVADYVRSKQQDQTRQKNMRRQERNARDFDRITSRLRERYSEDVWGNSLQDLAYEEFSAAQKHQSVKRKTHFEMICETEQVNRKAEEMLADCLEPNQHDKWNALRLHIIGAASVLEPSIVSHLALRDDQQRVIQNMLVSSQRSKTAITGPDQADRRRALETELKKEVGNVLTPDQREKWIETINKWPGAGSSWQVPGAERN